MNDNNFKSRQQTAIEQMREMNRRSRGKDQPSPPEPKTPPEPSRDGGTSSFLGGLNLPFLDNLKTDGDLSLILGILLLLLSEKADKRLLFALVYILL